MDIILWRHAQVNDDAPDQLRCLTELGHQQAQQMASWLDQRLSDDYAVWTSEAQRTRQTAAYLKHPALAMSGLNATAAYQDVLALIQRQPLNASLVLVGHQPWLGHLCHCLLNRTPTSNRLYPVSKGVIWWFGIDATEPLLHSRLKVMLSPDLVLPTAGSETNRGKKA
ncbi:MAG: histidine phosphatase family protein [Neisseriaceae bacterium]|nr:histidine phosphatase family protein [Neisseriaceae bacterium]